MIKFGNADQDLNRMFTKHRDPAKQRPQGPDRIQIQPIGCIGVGNTEIIGEYVTSIETHVWG